MASTCRFEWIRWQGQGRPIHVAGSPIDEHPVFPGNRGRRARPPVGGRAYRTSGPADPLLFCRLRCLAEPLRGHEIRFEQEIGANPFDHVALGLISIDFAKQESVLQHLERTQYDVVVIDEAHRCASLGDTGERDDSQRRQLAEVLARRSDGLVLLTATPHDGYDPHFASLIELLDPSLVDGRGSLRGDRYGQHVVRRLKRHIKKPGTDEPSSSLSHPKRTSRGFLLVPSCSLTTARWQL